MDGYCTAKYKQLHAPRTPILLQNCKTLAGAATSGRQGRLSWQFLVILEPLVFRSWAACNLAVEDHFVAYVPR